jgi:hypothetical protein
MLDRSVLVEAIGSVRVLVMATEAKSVLSVLIYLHW